MSRDFLALLADARMPSDARIVAMLILHLGEGWHELAHDQIAALLDGPSSETIRRHLRRLENAGWIESDTNTGRRPPKYRFRFWDDAGPFRGIRAALLASLPDPLPHTHEGQSPLPHTDEGQTKPFAPHPRGAEAVCPTPTRGKGLPSTIYSSSPSSTERARVPVAEISEAAERAIERAGDRLEGCRGSLRDYLRLRVEPRHQVGYVQRIVTSLDGADEWMWKDRTGKTLVDGRTKLLAAGLNELLTCDEIGTHYKDPPGGFGNLRTQIRYLVASALGVERDGKRPAGNGTAAATRGKPNASASTPRVHVEG